jgi:hypothetical protein
MQNIPLRISLMNSFDSFNLIPYSLRRVNTDSKFCKAKWQWNERCKNSFRKICELLSLSEVLGVAHYDPSFDVELAVDASSYGLGCVISHKYENRDERPIAYSSRTPTSCQNMLNRESHLVSFSGSLDKPSALALSMDD